MTVLAFPTFMQCQPDAEKLAYVHGIRFQGDRHADTDTIQRTIIDRYLEQPWDEDRLRNDLEETVKPLLKSYGFLRCIAEIDGKRETNGTIELSIRIKEGPQYRLSNLELTGATLFKTESLLQAFGVEPGGVTNMARIRERLPSIGKLYSNFGYIDFDYDQHIEIDDEAETCDVSISISEGKPYTIGRITFHGARAETDRALREACRNFQERRRYSSFHLDLSIEAINELGLYETLTRDDVNLERRSGTWGNEVNVTITLQSKAP